MSQNVLSPAHAEALGRDDGRSVVRDAIHAADPKQPNIAPQHFRAIIADGSMYSPSWRALPNGERVFQAAYDDDQLIGAYEYGLDSTVDAAEIDGSIGWEDGCLFYFGPDYDPS